MTPTVNQEALRSLPSVNEILETPGFAMLGDIVPHEFALAAARDEINEARRSILAGRETAPTTEEISAAALRKLRLMNQPSLKRVINAAGVVIHTNLGRSALADAAVKSVVEVAKGYSTLEYSTQNLARGSRHDHCESLICTLTGAEAAIAVNNNAAAVMMVLNEFAKGREAIVSRGEQVEIGGSFRIPDIMAYSNATMVEVGATNKTRLVDYERAITPETAMLLKVHTSNYRLIGFTESVSNKELRQLAARHKENGGQDIIVYEDLGSGVLLDVEPFRSAGEPTVSSIIAQGADLVSFSGDKLLGGPQAGIIVGKKAYIDRLKKNPLARALRLDKMTLAALEATLRIYLDQEQALRKIPTLAMLTETADSVKKKATNLQKLIAKAIKPDMAEATVVPEISRAGGGALPMFDIDTFCVQVVFTKGDALECDRFLNQQLAVPIIGRLKKEMLLFDARTILPGEDEEIAAGLSSYFKTLEA